MYKYYQDYKIRIQDLIWKIRVSEEFKKNSRIYEFMALVLERYKKCIIIISKLLYVCAIQVKYMRYGLISVLYIIPGHIIIFV